MWVKKIQNSHRISPTGILSILVLLLAQIPHPIQAANILIFFQVSTYSHQISIWPLVEALADRGHNVTFHSLHHPKIPNPKIHEFFPSSVETKIKNLWKVQPNLLGDFMNTRIAEGRFGTIRLVIGGLPKAGLEFCQEFLDAPETPQFLKTNTFDLVIIDSLFNECGFGLAHIFKAKTIIWSTSHPFAWTQEALGAIEDTSVRTELHLSYQYPLDFWQRVIATLTIIGTYYAKTWFYYPYMDDLFRSRFNDASMPSIQQLERETRLVFYNSHFSEEDPRALPPLFIPVGGLHCEWANGRKHKTAIPKDIAKFINETGEEGFIYVSMGGESLITYTPIKYQNIFYTAFRNSKIRFLWKWEGPRPKEMPNNVFTALWMPQEQILNSKKCRAFITHGGLLSMQEAISAGVPMISIPVFAEQDFNSFRLERTGRGILLEASTLTVEHLHHAIAQILSNPMYKENVVAASILFKDREKTPLESAIYWTEYILRHNDTSSLRPIAALDLYWFQRRHLDTWAFIFGVTIGTILIIIYIFVKLVACICCRRSKASKKDKSTVKFKSS